MDARGVTKLIFLCSFSLFIVGRFLIRFNNLAYILKIYSAEEISLVERESAVQRFCAALEAELGDAALVVPCHAAYRRLFLLFADHTRPWPVSAAEQLLADQWEAAELAATQAAFGVNRYLGDADFEIIEVLE